MKKITLWAVILMLSVVAIQGPAFADASPWTSEETYADKTGSKLLFGLKNVLFGWTDIFNQVSKYHDDGRGGVFGLGEGTWNALVYTAGGVLHTATFFIPVDIPLPEGGIQVQLA
ncbi:MAG: hypothetical protein A2Z83_06415 [Omnitrophica bacterium GWA2_52_8]|nr:MAG: hypothetical protein A2Z83_06415 [Omnitrophica bacterium GWA2_52_8]